MLGDPNSQLNSVKRDEREGWRLGTRKTGLKRFKTPVIITGRSKAVLSMRFHLFYAQCCSIFKHFYVSNLFNSVKVTATCLGKNLLLGMSSVILMFVKICTSYFSYEVYDYFLVSDSAISLSSFTNSICMHGHEMCLQSLMLSKERSLNLIFFSCQNEKKIGCIIYYTFLLKTKISPVHHIFKDDLDKFFSKQMQIIIATIHTTN